MNIRFRPRHRRRFAEWLGRGALLLVGSASAKPFEGRDDLTVLATTSLRIPHRERNAWLVSLNYTSFGEFLETAIDPEGNRTRAGRHRHGSVPPAR